MTVIYRGKYPKRVESLWISQGVAYVRTNDGGLYRKERKSGDAELPRKLAEIDVSDWVAMGQSEKRKGRA